MKLLLNILMRNGQGEVLGASFFFRLPDLNPVLAGIFRNVECAVSVIDQLPPIRVESGGCRADADTHSEGERPRRGTESGSANGIVNFGGHLQCAILICFG